MKLLEYKFFDSMLVFCFFLSEQSKKNSGVYHYLEFEVFLHVSFAE